MPRYSFTILCLLLASTAPVLPESVRASSRARADAEARDELLAYTVKRGDTLEALAASHFINPQDWRKAQEFNRLSAGQPLAAGSVLKLRQSWLKASPIKATIAAYRGAVEVQSSGQRVIASVGLKLDEGALLETGPNGFVTLRLPDASLVTLPSNSRIRLTRLRTLSITQSVDRRFTLEAGRSEAKVTPMRNPASKFMITTPVSVAAVRGTDFRVSFTPAEKTARVEVVEGKVAVSSEGEPNGNAGEVMLSAQFGTVATPAGLRKPIRLLEAPAFDQPLAVQSGKTVTFKLKPLAGATSYLVELATDASFTDRIASAESSSTELSFNDVPSGRLHARAIARDSSGLSGQPASFAFERRLVVSALGPLDSEPPEAGDADQGKPGASKKAEASAVAPLSDASTWSGIRLEPSANLSENQQSANGDQPAEEDGADPATEVEEGDAAWDGASAFGPLSSDFNGGFGRGGGSGGGGGGGWFKSDAAGGNDSGPALPSFADPAVATVPLFPEVFQPAVSVPLLSLVTSSTEAAATSPLLPNSATVAPPMVVPAFVPEPASWALLITGFGLVGLALRRRQLGKA